METSDWEDVGEMSAKWLTLHCSRSSTPQYKKWQTIVFDVITYQRIVNNTLNCAETKEQMQNLTKRLSLIWSSETNEFHVHLHHFGNSDLMNGLYYFTFYPFQCHGFNILRFTDIFMHWHYKRADSSVFSGNGHRLDYIIIIYIIWTKTSITMNEGEEET